MKGSNWKLLADLIGLSTEDVNDYINIVLKQFKEWFVFYSASDLRKGKHSISVKIALSVARSIHFYRITYGELKYIFNSNHII